MVSIVYPHEPPPAGTVLSTEATSFPPDLSARLSIHQLVKNAHETGGRNVFWTTDVATELPIRVADYGPGSEAPITVIESFADTVRRYKTRAALFWQKAYGQPNTPWESLTWQQFWNEVCRFAKGLIAVGFPDYARVCILGYNAPAWFIAELGAMFAHGISVGIYTTNQADAVGHILEDTEAPVLVIDTVEQLNKVATLKRQGRAKTLRVVVMYAERPPALADLDPAMSSVTVLFWDDFMAKSAAVRERDLTARMEAARPGQCCSLCYTSGTTGVPKGVMLSHDNMTWVAGQCTASAKYDNDDCAVSYLPLSHIAGQMIDVFIPLASGMAVFFAAPDALRGTLMDTVREVRPTFFFAPPRIWEKIEEKMKAIGAQSTGLRKRLAEWAKAVGSRGTNALLEGDKVPFGFSIAERLVFSKVREALGFDRCRGFGAGAAPLPKATQEYFLSLGIPICDMYGMSESPGPSTLNINIPKRFRVGSPGQTLSGTQLRIDHPDARGHGEICWRGRNVFMGYFKNEEASRQTIDSHGFLHSGDIGYTDSDGFLYITGRIKELLITAGGENIPPVLIENICKEEMPFLSNCQLIGDRKPFLSLLVCLKSEVDENMQPTDTLSVDVAKLMRTRGVANPPTSVRAAATHPVIQELLAEGIQRVNSRATSRAQQIRKWRVLPADFTVASGELTPTLKLKRPVVLQKYNALVNEIYEGADTNNAAGVGGGPMAKL
mmetsp:Transcript_5720/g.13657  ORF Transcript_5720/g.13657 Transcript_5720/m.13657 type:complete len:722 (+) Transcript_5720:98-2263(+)